MSKILQISDLHLQNDPTVLQHGFNAEWGFQQVLSQAHALHGRFDLILLSGDLAETPSPATYQRLKLQLQSYQTPSLCLPGNHDAFQLMQSYLQNDLVSCARNYSLGNWHLVCLHSQKLHSPNGELAETELAFLTQVLQDHPDQPTLVTVHHHCLPTGCPWLDCMQIANSDEFLTIVQTYPQVKAISFGHIHQEMQHCLNDLQIFGVPSTCYQFKPNTQEFTLDHLAPGYRIIELGADGSLVSTCYRIN